ncbi:MAG: translation initiation factor IF-2 [Candidatus Obscuribacterales bacterium]|nr:translation initiation factor IF-2 [Candidatus Obscuribacterales bacterium]
MDDRKRIYELARQMNLSNQVIIDALRELGYDIKSHSSTVDKQAIGLLIAHLGKKKDAPKAAGKTSTATTPGAPGAAKPAAKAAAPTPPPVKPRVLNRYRPTPINPVEPVAEPAPAAAAAETTNQPLGKNAPAQQPGKGQQASATATLPVVNPPLEQTPEVPEAAPAPQIVEPEGKEKGGKTAPAAIEPEPTQESSEPSGKSEPTTDKASDKKSGEKEKPAEAKGKGTKTPEPTERVRDEEKEEARDKKQDEEDVPSEQSKTIQAIRPMTPSVPIRIAAPSFRATPPRPPKHRGGTADRHAPKREEKLKPQEVAPEVPKEIALTSSITVKELAEKMQVTETDIIKRLMVKGFMRTINQMVELELARELAAEMGYELQSLEDIKLEEALKEEEKKEEERKAADNLTDDEKAALVGRPPVVTIMGHVDHGKTSLLDAIRQTKFLLTDAEHGGITQHIGAYHVEVSGEDGQLRQVVFLDTPGHEAFTAMRARGARCTDIAILVVAADDGVMPQTIEAIDHAKAAGVPIIVAVNKVDKAGADPDRVLSQLMEHGLLPDRFGGDTVTVNVSAKKKTGLDELLEMILLVADMQDLKANPERPATGVIVEAELHRGKGAVATALVQNGTLRMGDIIVAGSVFGRVRALLDDRGQQVRAAGPSMPVEVLGLPEVPSAGDKFEVVTDQQIAKQMVEERKLVEIERKTHRVTLESLHDLVEQGEVHDLNIIVKADVLGTAEAIADQVRKLSTKEVNVRVLRAATGDISENDVNLATSSNAIVIGFNVQPDTNATRAAEGVGVDIRTYNIIYEIIDNLELAIQGLLQPIKQEVQIGSAEVRQVFKLGKNQVIAGCYVISGKIPRNGIARVVREDKQIFEGKIDTLRRFKDDVREVAQGFECGMSLERFNDIIEGDIINVHIIQEVKREITR